jgi:hypothetical protein
MGSWESFYKPYNVNHGPGTVKIIMQYRTLTTPYRRKHSDRPNVALLSELISSTPNQTSMDPVVQL